MAQATASVSFADRIKWNERLKPALIVLVIAAIAYLVGANMIAPRTFANQPTFLPAAYATLPLGSMFIMNADGSAALLPVRIADTSAARNLGFKGVGEQALDNTFLLYPLARETTARTSYSVEGARAPIEFAAIDANGTVVAVETSAPGATRVSIAERHQWLIAAKAGTLDRFGVGVGSTIDPEQIRRF
jgi:uncharacterized membrane protein (UPF0127 family)